MICSRSFGLVVGLGRDVGVRLRRVEGHGWCRNLSVPPPVSDYVRCSTCIWNGIRRFMSSNNKKGRRTFTVSVEGNIGSGKTAFLEHFNNSQNVDVIQEPVDKWRNIRGFNALGAMYEDPKRWTLTFQTYVQLTMLQNHTAQTAKPVKMMERSIYSAKYCFVENHRESVNLTGLEYIVLTEWFDWIVENEACHVDLIVYLRTDPQTVYDRIKKRCRPEEKAIPLEYLTSLHTHHEDWLVRKKFPVPAPVLVFDANKDLPDLYDIYDNHREEILCGHN